MSGFGTTSAPAFGGSYPPGTNFDQRPNVGAFWSNPAQTSSLGSINQPSQPAFGNNMFGGSQPAFGITSTPAFGATSSQGFGGTSTPVFGSTWSPAFGESRTQAFGSSSFPFATPTSSAPGFSSSTASFSFPSPHDLGQSNFTFSGNPVGASSIPMQNFPSGAQATMPTSGNTGFWNSAFGGQHRGSRVATYTNTIAPDSFGNGNSPTVVRFMSISAMPVYINKSHEELRHEDYLMGDRGGLTPAGGSGFVISTTQSRHLNPSSVFAQTSSTPFNASTSSSIFSPQTLFTYTGFRTSSSPFTQSASPFWPSSTTNLFTPPSSSPSVFGKMCPPSSLSTPATSSFTFPAPSSYSTFNFTPTSSNAQIGSAFGQTSNSFWPTQTPIGQSNMFNSPSSGFSTPINFVAPSTSSPSSSVFGKLPSPFTSQTTSAFPFSAPPSTSTSTYNSGLRNFTPSTPQTGGTFGQTSTLFGQNIFNNPFSGIGSGGSSAAIPTSNLICFSQPAFVDKESDKDMDMDDWVLC
ncbi:nuclear pore complex protein NUP98A-like [Argentina anserina]|uniref:nuclear pore complex protein NUP98A-like n=1 Tax=Argentina anserina TaxID=57926 RepID=UPI00217643F3|nr:nuclear pore complex protein NUP98A-like [Potentilla anserina]